MANCVSDFGYVTNSYEFLSPLGYATSLGQADSSSECRFFNPSGTSSTSHKIEYDLGADLSAFAPANFLGLFEFWYFIKFGGTVSITVKAADDSGFSSGLVSASLGSFDESDLTGIQGKDVYATFDDFSVNKRYWQVEITTSNSVNYPVRDIVLGRKIEVDRNPTTPIKFKLNDSYSEAKRNTFFIELKYEFLSKENKQSLRDEIFMFEDVATIILLDEGNRVFFGKKILRAASLNNLARIKAKGQGYKIELNFEDLL